jgi:hypothetical protein
VTPREGPNPRLKNDVRSTVFDGRNERAPRTIDRPVQGASALDVNHGTEIDLPCVADAVALMVLNGARAGRVVGLDASGR